MKLKMTMISLLMSNVVFSFSFFQTSEEHAPKQATVAAADTPRPSMCLYSLFSQPLIFPKQYRPIIFENQTTKDQWEYTPRFSTFTCQVPGTYSFHYSVIVQKSSGGRAKVFLRALINNNEIQSSKAFVDICEPQKAVQVKGSFLLKVRKKDVLTFQFASDSPDVQIIAAKTEKEPGATIVIQQN